MNLEQSDSFKSEIEKNTRHKRAVVISIAFCGVLLVLLFALMLLIQHQDSITEKLYIDDKQITLKDDFYKTVDNNIYINVNEFAELLNYKYFKGEYGQYNENNDSCYIENEFEIVALTAGEKSFDKYLQLDTSTPLIAEIPVTLKNENGYKEKFILENEILYIDEKIYVPLESMTDIFNVNTDWKQYRFKFYTLEYVVEKAKKAIGKLGFSEMTGYYENLKTALYNYMIVGNGSETNTKNSSSKYGIISLKDGKEIAGVKYTDMRFVQNTKEFYVTVEDGSMGIIDATGKIIINAKEYENISLLDDDAQLYLVEKDKQYGVINRLGKTIIYAENDSIGIDVEQFKITNIENNCLLFDKCIPVEKDGKFGLFDVNGECILNLVYDGFGYTQNSDTKLSGNEQSVLVIPPEIGINGIIINMNDLYGIYDVDSQKIILPCVASKIYAITKSGKTNYYYDFNNEQIDIAQWLVASGLYNYDLKNNIDDNKETENSDLSNTSSNIVTEQNTDEDNNVIVTNEAE